MMLLITKISGKKNNPCDKGYGYGLDGQGLIPGRGKTKV
jgi:hypothetical protein